MERPVSARTFVFYGVGSTQMFSQGVQKCIWFSKGFALYFTPGTEKHKSYLQKGWEYLSSLDILFAEAYFKFRSEKLV